jgi:hypothetical protein
MVRISGKLDRTGERKDTDTKRKLEDDVDALFRLPLAEFTAARNTLAARLKKADAWRCWWGGGSRESAGQAFDLGVDREPTLLEASPSIRPAYRLSRAFSQKPSHPVLPSG